MELGEKQLGHKRQEPASSPEHHFQAKITVRSYISMSLSDGNKHILEPSDLSGVKNSQLICRAIYSWVK